MLHWYCKATYNLGQIFSLKATYNLGRREYIYRQHYCISQYVCNNLKLTLILKRME